MSKKHECTRENLMRAYKARDFQRIAQSHPAWLRQESGKGDHKIEYYEAPKGDEIRNPWDGSHGEVSIGVRHMFVRVLVQNGLLVLATVIATIMLLRGGE
jgi:hypothetical protein